MSATISSEFPSLAKQAKGITYVYKLVGLYSIVLLTVVTIISMTNVFTSGEFAQWPGVRNTWAFIFALSIDVNIVRLFIEGYLDKSKAAYTIGGGLVLVTGSALFIEGLEQSVGLQWSNQYVQGTITVLIGLRVLLVVILMAREGAKLGKLAQQSLTTPTEQKEQAPSVASELTGKQAPDQAPIGQESEQGPNTEKIEAVNPEVTIPKEQKSKVIAFTGKSKAERVRKVLENNPGASLTSIAQKAKVSRGYASQIRQQIMSQQEQVSMSI